MLLKTGWEQAAWLVGLSGRAQAEKDAIPLDLSQASRTESQPISNLTPGMEMEESSSLSCVALGGQVYQVWGKAPGFLDFMLFGETQRMPDAAMDTVMSIDFLSSNVPMWMYGGHLLWIKNILILLLWGYLCAIKRNSRKMMALWWIEYTKSYVRGLFRVNINCKISFLRL